MVPHAGEKVVVELYVRPNHVGKRLALVEILGLVMLLAVYVALPSLSSTTQLVSAIVPFVFVLIFNRRNFSHPVNCVLPFVLLCTLSYPAYSYFTGLYSSIVTQVLQVHVLFAAFFMLPSILIVDNRYGRRRQIQLKHRELTSAFVTGWCVLAIGTIALLYAASTGATSKQEALRAVSPVVKLSIHLLITAPACCLLLELRRLARLAVWRPSLLSLVTVVVLLLGYLVVGERDFVFRGIVLAGIFVFDFCAQYKTRYGSIALVAIVLLSPLSQSMKAYGLAASQGEQVAVSSGYQAVEQLFGQEFATSGRNLYYLISYSEQDLGWRLLIEGLKRTAYVANAENSVRWFHDVFRPSNRLEGSSGWGFTLSGEAYICLGSLGVIGFALVYGLGIAFLYLIRLKNEYFYVWYALAVYGAVYVQRGDIANYVAFVFKGPFVIVFVLYILSRFIAPRFGRVVVANKIGGKVVGF